MPTQTSHPPFAPGAQGQPAGQAASENPPPREGHTTRPLAERHEALWLSLTALPQGHRGPRRQKAQC